MRANSLCSHCHHFCRFHSPSDLLCNFPIHSLYSVPIISVPVIISKSLQYRYSISRVQRSKIQMGCRKEGLGEDANSKAAMAASVSDALLLATMCIIGLPVDVHAKDGSVYSGVFHTASVDNDYGITGFVVMLFGMFYPCFFDLLNIIPSVVHCVISFLDFG